MFSATFNVLPGSEAHPEFITIVNPVAAEDLHTQATAWNRLSYYPVISTISGIARALLGIVHIIVHIACSLFSASREYHLTQAKLGASNVLRGAVEVVPLIGNLACFVRDMIRGFTEMKKAKEYLDSHPENRNKVVLLVNGEAQAENTKEEFFSKLVEAGFSPGKLPTIWDHFTLLRA